MAKKSPTGKLAGITSDAVRLATGKGWDEWLMVLDADGAADMTHAEIAIHLSENRGVGPWWSQMVTVGYEQGRGRRVKHQKTDGFSVSSSKTVGVPLAKLYSLWADAKRRKVWLAEPIEIRTATKNKSMRISWSDGTIVSVNFYAKGAGKSMVQVEHVKLKGAAIAAKMKAVWKTRLQRMSDGLVPG